MKLLLGRFSFFLPVWKYICKNTFFYTIQHCNCLGNANMLVLYAGLGREMAAYYDYRSCTVFYRGPVKSSPRYKRIRHIGGAADWVAMGRRWGGGGGISHCRFKRSAFLWCLRNRCCLGLFLSTPTAFHRRGKSNNGILFTCPVTKLVFIVHDHLQCCDTNVPEQVPRVYAQPPR